MTPSPALSQDINLDADTALPQLRGPGGRRLIVLLADDNPVNREVGRALLEELGLEVHTALDGRDAVNKAAAGQFDLVLMDVQMPKLDGLAATRELRNHAKLAAVPVIAMTANAADQNRDDCLAAGMNDFLTKPVDLWALAAMLARWLPR